MCAAIHHAAHLNQSAADRLSCISRKIRPILHTRFFCRCAANSELRAAIANSLDGFLFRDWRRRAECRTYRASIYSADMTPSVSPPRALHLAARIVAVGLALVLTYVLRNARFSAASLWCLGAAVVVVVGFLTWAGRHSRQKSDSTRTLSRHPVALDFARGLDCFLAALAWMLIVAPWIKSQAHLEMYAGAGLSIIPAIPLTVLGIFFLVRWLSRVGTATT